MVKTDLSDEEKKTIIEALNSNTEPSAELMTKLFPGLAEKFDVAKLDRAKVVTLEYAGKRSEAAILNQASPTDAGSPLQVERCFQGGSLTGETQLDLFEKAKDGTDDNWQNLIVQGDNLQFLKTCHRNADQLIKDRVKGKVKLIYIDPPFATKSDFKGSGDEKSYSDKVASAEFIEGLRERLIYMHDILAEDGTIYVHLDWKMSHYAKIILDEVFGRSNFLNEIIWHYYNIAPSSKKFFAKNHDIVLWYTKENKKQTFNLEELRIPYEKGSAYAKKGWSKSSKYAPNPKGKLMDDVWRIPTINNMAKERIGYPSQKPESLLERIILASSNPGDLIMDVFAGSGTTAGVAEKLGRRWIVCDFGKHAIYTMQKRMLRIGESKALGKDVKQNQKYGKQPRPFCVVSAGAYDFSRIMKLRDNKDAYIDFVLGLFQSSRDEKDLSGKYRLANIFGEKDGDPVEVYPVWDDEYLKNIRIDENYLKGIILQSRGKLKGNYYIITPETCTLIGDTTMKNSAGNDVHFKMLKFPYKILEDVSRNFQIQQQPSSQENVNNLINSTGFYFNDDVEIAVERIKQGLKITQFETKILDNQGERLKGLDGLAMLLVDVDYDGKIFDMDRTVFAKDIGEDGVIKVTGLTESIAVVAIDKHGNESKPFIIKDE
ncbi:DNA methyltransferase [Desulfobacula sp.]|uniref:DNA methyltransferase n=1 Tax=Desulfobacula sp. TaxID=2593537 RepID=UPI001EB1D8DE|nr:site-specific DNA-methyltransferase [Desulfobacula sp.]